MNNLCKFEAMKALLSRSGEFYVVCVDNDGYFSYVNDFFEKKFTQTDHHLTGQPYRVVMHPDDVKICEKVSTKCYAFPDQLFPAGIRILNKQGEYTITQWEFTLITENGLPTGVFCIGHKIAGYEQISDKYFLVSDDHKVKREILGAIAYEQSHIARAPLANILGLINVLKNYQLDPEAEIIVNMLQQSSILLDEVIKSVAKKTFAV